MKVHLVHFAYFLTLWSESLTLYLSLKYERYVIYLLLSLRNLIVLKVLYAKLKLFKNIF